MFVMNIVRKKPYAKKHTAFLFIMNLHHGYCVNGYDFSLFSIQIEALVGLVAWHDDHDLNDCDHCV